eukprot:CAMPEP_0175762766 /NCGR_PEP_ID=MMETSP0097-20121207/67377_1 /TAXON_ID=311494 /ORGANISM="Alexandrium monilatum, Strain CCMP3105" /LENGTH=40 /DNA_ID= /DNA_START= /DNA_END= /DNA_ORIENTATION=
MQRRRGARALMAGCAERLRGLQDAAAKDPLERTAERALRS